MCQHVPRPHPHFYLLVLAASCLFPSLQLSPTYHQVLIFQSRLLVQYRSPHQALKPSSLDQKYHFPTLQAGGCSQTMHNIHPQVLQASLS